MGAMSDAKGRVRQVPSRMSARRRAKQAVAVIGAGPYGLSAAVHLKAGGMSVRVFGQPMEFWAKRMPEGMLLRSPRVASSISDPWRALTLEAYEGALGVPPKSPLPLHTFVQYGMWFQQQLKEEIDPRNAAVIRPDSAGFAVTLEDGEERMFKRVVVAAGIGAFRHKPAVFEQVDRDLASHCYEGRNLRDFGQGRVIVIGGGQSALESAALLNECGADVEVLVKKPVLHWVGMHAWLHRLGPISRLLYSSHDVGPAGISRLVAMPRLMYHIPLQARDRIRIRAVRPAGAKWLRERLGNVKFTTGRSVVRAWSIGRQVRIMLDDGSERSADHILMGTGYSVDVARYPFMSKELLAGIRVIDGYPVLKPGFCSSMPGLHFIGATAARSYGPLMYFVAGTDFTSRSLVSRIIQSRDH